MTIHLKMFYFLTGLLLFAATACHAGDELKNLPELSMPLSSTKLVIAHNMTNIIRFKGHEFEDSCNPHYYSPAGNITSALGGLTQVRVLADSILSNASLEEAVKFEMKAAKLSGIDGFQFYYTLGSKNWDKIIEAYFRVADREDPDFKFTFCISHPDGSSEQNKIREFAERINAIMLHAGRDNRHWLRTPDGRLIVYLWNGDGLADIPAGKKEFPDQYYIARAYRKLADAVKDRFACISLINEAISEEKLNATLDYFPAVWIWTLPYHSAYIGQYVARACKARRRTFTGSAFCDFYTSKLLKPGTWDMFYRAEDAVKAGIKSVERKYIATGLSYNFRKLLEFGIREDVPVINIITWNDYPEGHHLAPEINHNYGFSTLLSYYKSIWRSEMPGILSRKDIAIVFFKKYKQHVRPSPFFIPLINFEKEAVPMPVEDSIEVLTILPSGASLLVNGKTVNVPTGLHSARFPSAAGPVEVSVLSNGIRTVHFVTPEWITANPYRTDRLTYSFSSDYMDYHRQLFGSLPPVYSGEYNRSGTMDNGSAPK